MQAHDFDRFSVIMLGVAENYGQSLSPQGIALRFQALASHTVEEVERAVMSIIACRKYTTMPTVADFLEYMNGGSAKDKAEVEVGKVLSAISSHGGYASVVFDDPVTQAVIVQAYGGWVKLCEECGTDEPEKWFRKEFAKTWAAYNRQGIRQYGHLPGRIEIANVSNGFLHENPQPKIIGDASKAKAVLQAGKSLVLTEGGGGIRGKGRSLPELLESMQGRK